MDLLDGRVTSGEVVSIYASGSQINAVIPFFSLSNGPIHVITPNGTTPDFVLTLVPSRPEVFHNPDGSAIAVNQDGTLNSANHPAPPNSYVSIWMTGSGALPPQEYAGMIATSANNYYCCGVLFSGEFAPVIYAGEAPGAVLGVSQVNFQVPFGDYYSNGVPATLQVTGNDGAQSLPVTFYVH